MSHLTNNPVLTGTVTLSNGPLVLAASQGIVIPTGAPGVTTDKLYQVGGTVYFNGSALGGGGSTYDLLSNLKNAEVSISSASVISAFNTMHVFTGTTADYTVTIPGCTGNAGKFFAVRGSKLLTKKVTLEAPVVKTGTVSVPYIGTEIGSNSSEGLSGTISSSSFRSPASTQTQVGDLVHLWNSVTGHYAYASRVTAAPGITFSPSLTMNGAAQQYVYVEHVVVVGSGTLFTTEYSIGSQITIGGETKTVQWIGDNTHLAVDSSFASTKSGVAHTDPSATYFKIDGQNNLVIGPNDFALLYCDGSSWICVANSNGAFTGKNVTAAGFASSTSSSVTPFLKSTRTDLSNTVTLEHVSANLLQSSAQIQLPNDPTAPLQAATKQFVETTALSVQPASLAAAIGPWVDYTPIWTSSGTQPSIGNGALVGKWRRVGDSMEVTIVAVFGTTTTFGTGTYNFSLPSGYTFNGTAAQTLGPARLFYSAHNSGLSWLSSTTTLGVLVPAGFVGQTVPVTWASGNEIDIRATVPIAQWSSNINLIKDFTEYASCDGTAGVAANTTYTPTTVNSYLGSSVPSVAIAGTSSTTQTTYDLTFVNEIKPTDLLQIELSSNPTIGWMPLASLRQDWFCPGVVQNNVMMGISFTYISPKVIRVYFSNAGRCTGPTYGVASGDWAAISGSWKWRVRKTSNGNFAQGSPSYSETIGNNSATTIDVTHNLGTTDVNVSVFELTGNKRKVDNGLEIRQHPTNPNNQVRLVFTAAPATASLRVTVFSSGGTQAMGDRLSSISKAEVAVSAASTAVMGCWNVCTAASVNYTLTLPPAASYVGQYVGIRIKPNSTYLVTVTGNGAELIDGQNTRVMWAGEVAELYSDGTTWTKVGGKTIPMISGLRMNAAQTFANLTFTNMNLDASAVTQAPSAMQEIANKGLRILRPGNYNYTLSAYYASNAVACTRYIVLGFNGAATGSYPRDHHDSPANITYCSKTSGVCTLTLNTLVTAMCYYSAGTPSPTLAGDTAMSAMENTLILTEIPTW